MYEFSQRSLDELTTCHKDLIILFNEVIKQIDCTVLCGHRNEEDQNNAYPKNSSVQWPNSKHNTKPSIAVDVVPYPIDWEDRARQHEFATIVYDTAMKLNIRIRWGGRFKKKNGKIFYDSPHWELIND